MVNLLKNAFEAMSDLPPEGRIIDIATSRHGDMVEVEVSDYGPGVT